MYWVLTRYSGQLLCQSGDLLLQLSYFSFHILYLLQVKSFRDKLAIRIKIRMSDYETSSLTALNGLERGGIYNHHGFMLTW